MLPLSNLVFRNSLVIFCYHDVTECPSAFSTRFGLNIPPSVFEDQIDFISKHFNMISPLDLSGDYIPTPGAMISFDDGFRSYFENAVPILQRKGIPSIIFLNMEAIEGNIFWSGLITYLSLFDEKFGAYAKSHNAYGENEKRPLFLSCDRKMVSDYLSDHLEKPELLRKVRKFYGELARIDDLMAEGKSNLVYFGNHLYNHYNVKNMSDDEFQREYITNARKLSHFPNAVPFFSYPFGQPETCFDSHHTDLLYAFGARLIFFSSGGINNGKMQREYDRIALDQSISNIWGLTYFVWRGKLLRFLRSALSRVWHGWFA